MKNIEDKLKTFTNPKVAEAYKSFLYYKEHGVPEEKKLKKTAKPEISRDDVLKMFDGKVPLFNH